MTLANFEDILFTVSGLSMNGLAETEIVTKTSAREWMEKLFMNNGFRVDVIRYEEVAKSLGKELAAGPYKNVQSICGFLMVRWKLGEGNFNELRNKGMKKVFEEL